MEDLTLNEDFISVIFFLTVVNIFHGIYVVYPAWRGNSARPRKYIIFYQLLFNKHSFVKNNYKHEVGSVNVWSW